MVACNAFLSQSPIDTTRELFHTLLRTEQVRRNAHILCLPFEVRFYILYLLHRENIVSVYKSIGCYMSVISPNDVQELRCGLLKLKKKWFEMQRKCQILVNLHFDKNGKRIDSEWQADWKLMVLARGDVLYEHNKCKELCAMGTNKGRYILSIINTKNITNLCRGAEHAISRCSRMHISVHRCAFAMRSERNPFHGEEEMVSLEHIGGDKLYWVDNSKTVVSSVLLV